MARNLEHDVFTLIVTHNKLASKDDCKHFLAEADSPEDALQRMVASNFFSEKVAVKIRDVYQRKLAKEREKARAHTGDGSGSSTSSGSGNGNGQQPAAKPDAQGGAATATAEAEAPAQPAASAADRLASARKNAPTGLETDSVTGTAESMAAKSKLEQAVQAVDYSKPGKQLADALLRCAKVIGASDMHLRPDEIPIVRRHGVFDDLPLEPLPAETCHETLVSLLDDEKRQRFEEHWDFDFCYDAGEAELGRFRVNLMKQHRGSNGVFRLIPNEVPDFDTLGLPEVVARFTEYRTGLVLVTGPKGCGKTTTLASLIKMVNESRAEHIITLEDPIEYVHPCIKGHVNQREVGSHTQTFANALRAALREAPDVIMVGEMRDLETISLAITAAETGHLVFGTLHTPDSVRTINRILDVFPPKEQGQIRAMVSESLRGVVSQLLVPSAEGEGMLAACEILVNTGAIGNLIRDDRCFQIRGVMQTGKKLGMVSMDESLVHLAQEGRISNEEALLRADNQNNVRRELGMPVN